MTIIEQLLIIKNELRLINEKLFSLCQDIYPDIYIGCTLGISIQQLKNLSKTYADAVGNINYKITLPIHHTMQVIIDELTNVCEKKGQKSWYGLCIGITSVKISQCIIALNDMIVDLELQNNSQ